MFHPPSYLSGLKVFPATLKILPTGADVAGIDRYSVASLLGDGNLKEFPSQNIRGFSDISQHGSSIYSSASICPVLPETCLSLYGVECMKL